MSKLLLLDCDGTIREPLSGKKFIQHPRDQRIIEGVDKAIAHYSSREWTIIGTSNQGGVAAKHKSIEACEEEQFYTLELLPQVHSILFCPDYEGEVCVEVTREYCRHCYNEGRFESFRKPGAGMIQLALMEYPASECWYVGDRPEDEQAAAAAGVDFMWADIWRNRFR